MREATYTVAGTQAPQKSNFPLVKTSLVARPTDPHTQVFKTEFIVFIPKLSLLSGILSWLDHRLFSKHSTL